MIKTNLRRLILTSLVTLIPIVVGLCLWNRLPELIPAHWNINGEVDSYSSKAFVVFGFPALLLAIHWICAAVSSLDPGHKHYPAGMVRVVLWICPVIALTLSSLTYTNALGYSVSVGTVCSLLFGILFVIVGNLLPKCRQSYTLGIKLPWTLSNEENWNMTHRFAGKLWMGGGIAILALSMLGNFWILMGILVIMVAVPTCYSWNYARKHS